MLSFVLRNSRLHLFKPRIFKNEKDAKIEHEAKSVMPVSEKKLATSLRENPKSPDTPLIQLENV